MIVLPPQWESAMAPVATMLTCLGPPFAWWIAGALLLAGGIVLAARRPAWVPAVAAVATLALGVATDGLVDDAYIQFRYAANLAGGAGPVFNAGERIEGASGGVWIGALALGPTVLGVDAGRWGRGLSLALSALATFAAGLAVRAAAGADAGAAAALLWAGVPTTAMYAATGLETAGYALALWLAVWAAAGSRQRLAWFPGAAASALRPEALVLGVAASPWMRRSSRPVRAVVVGTLGGAALMVLARLAYFGAGLPRSVTVKGFSAAAGPQFGVAYIGHGLVEWWPLLIGLPLVLGRWRTVLPAAAGVAAWTTLVVVRGGDWMPGSRYLLPLLAILVAGSAATSRRWARASVLTMVCWGCLLLVPVADPAFRVAGSSWRAMAEHRVQSRWWEALGASLRRALPPTTSVASGPSGALPYASEMPTLDMFGLCSVVTQGREGGTGHRLWGLRQAAGHRDVIYIGSPLPQVRDARIVTAAAEATVADIQSFRLEYQPVVLFHDAGSSLDVVADVIWVRPSLVPPLLSSFRRLEGRNPR